VKGSRLSPRDSSRLRVDELYEALLVRHKYGHIQIIFSILIRAI